MKRSAGNLRHLLSQNPRRNGRLAPPILTTTATRQDDDMVPNRPRHLSTNINNSTSSYASGKTTHFGYQNVPTEQKQDLVLSVFQNVAESYDIMNDLMSAGLHRLWKDELVRRTGVSPMASALRRLPPEMGNTTQLRILDVAGGTGDVAFRFLEAAKCHERSLSTGRDETVDITVCDINPDMLRVGERRARSLYGNGVLDSARSLRFQEGNAESLPFKGDEFDLYTIAFGLRNVTDVDRALRDAYRVLKPGGRFLCLEFSEVPEKNHPVLAKVYDWYSFGVIPLIGEVVADDRSSYQYLVESIRKFCNQGELVDRMEGAGFVGCKYTNMSGGIVAIHEGWKPLE